MFSATSVRLSNHDLIAPICRGHVVGASLGLLIDSVTGTLRLASRSERNADLRHTSSSRV